MYFSDSLTYVLLVEQPLPRPSLFISLTMKKDEEKKEPGNVKRPGEGLYAYVDPTLYVGGLLDPYL